MKIIIIGNSGSGKTWLARAISNVSAAPVVHLDEIYWEPGGFDHKRSSEAVNELIKRAKMDEGWIVEGVFGELAERFLIEADQLIWLDMEWAICKLRLEQRGSESKEHLDREQSQAGLARLLEWAEKYYERTDLRSYSGHNALFETFGKCRLRLREESDVMALVHDIQHSAAKGRACAPLS
jgi:adenylate kinase family enzyme